MRDSMKKRILALTLAVILAFNGSIAGFASEVLESETAAEAVVAAVSEEATEATVEATEAVVPTVEEIVPATEAETETVVETEAESVEETPEETVKETEAETETEVETETVEETEEETEEEYIQILEYEDSDVEVNVKAASADAIPEDASLKVTPITKSDKEYNDVEKQLNEKAEDEEYEIAGFLAYDITFVDKDGNEVEPNGDVRVTIDYKKATLPASVKSENAENLDVTVMHLEENAKGQVKEVVDMVAATNIEATVTTTKNAEVKIANFVTDNFSVFTITWKANNTTNNFTVNTWTNGTWQRLDTNLDGNKFEIETGTTINLLTDSRFVATANGTTYKVAFGVLQNISGHDLSERIATIKVSYSNGTWKYECELTNGTDVTYTDSEIIGIKLFYDVVSSDSGDYDTGDTYTVYVYVGSYTDKTKKEVISEECIELLGIDKSTIDGNGYFPVGEIQIAKSLINSKGANANIGGQPLITSEADWQEVLDALGELNTTTLIDELGVSYSNNRNNNVGEYLDQAAGDINFTWGTMRTALFRWNDTEHYGFSGSNTGIKYHLDLRFNTNKITFITGNNGIKSGAAKDGTTVDSRTYITGSIIQEPRNLNIPEGYKFAGYFEDPDFTKEWNGIGTPLNEDQTVYIRIVEKEHVVLYYKVAQGEGSVSRDMDDFNPVTGNPVGSTATPDTNYIFDGWYADETCTVLISKDENYVPTKPAAGWESIDGKTYWAKFIIPTTTHTVEKVWIDDGEQNRPEINVQLYANEIATDLTATLNKENNWIYTFEDLPSLDSNNEPIVYKAVEVSVEGYNTTYLYSEDGLKTEITNTQLLSVAVKKVWNDLDNIYGLRPGIIEVVLTKNNVDTETKLILNAENSWKAVFEDLPKYEIVNGEKTGIEYGVREISVPEGYTASDAGVGILTDGVYTITNTLNRQQLKLIKQSETNNSPLSGAKFKLERLVTDEGGVTSVNLVTEVVTSAEGIIFNSELPYGTYKLTEIEAPSGYMLLEKPFYIDVTASGISYWTESSEDTTVVTADENGTYQFVVYNTALYELPSTGSIGIYWYMIAGMMMMMIATAITYKNRREEVLERVDRR